MLLQPDKRITRRFAQGKAPSFHYQEDAESRKFRKKPNNYFQGYTMYQANKRTADFHALIPDPSNTGIQRVRHWHPAC